MDQAAGRSSWFERILLPGFAFKAVVIGGGYATGRELAEFFLPSGPWGGLLGMALAMVIWSGVCILTFLFARRTQSWDYRTFFRNLLGPAWPVFEFVYFLFVILILAVFAAAAGAIAEAMFGLPRLAGALALMSLIAAFATWGNRSVEQLFKYVSFFLYATYAAFVLLTLSRTGDQTLAAFATPAPMDGWASGGVTYAGYNIIGAVIILPVLRHMTSRRDAVIAGALAGPLAMIPAALFFICMIGFYPAIESQALPSDYMLEQLNLPAFRLIFQLMIFAALLESGTGSAHAINERLAHAFEAEAKRPFPTLARFGVSAAVLTASVFVADRFGLVALIANGYRWLAYAFLAIYVTPLVVWAVWRALTRRQAQARAA